MEAQYWQQAWDEGKIGFHQSKVNTRLVKYWSHAIDATNDSPLSGSAVETAKSCVFVPLCGKSLDMLWLHQQGHQVLGVELSAIAAKAFFEENNLEFEETAVEGFTFFTGTANAEGITLMAGDFFQLTAEHTRMCTALYDRASMIAMTPDMRADYARRLAVLMPSNSRGILLTISYDQSRMQGPPFSVSDDNARTLLSENFLIDQLEHFSGPERLGNLAKRGLETLDERVYLLTRK